MTAVFSTAFSGSCVREIRRELDDLREKVDNVSGFREEIDHALERIAAIEKHIGLPSHA
jgi:predicted component of type VI protein secretion system